MIELIGGTLAVVEDAEKRRRLLDNLAKARAARQEKRALRQSGELPPEPKKPKKLKGKREFNEVLARGRKPSKAPLAGWTSGLSAATCAIACTAEKCMITGENVCGHPNKGGLQGKYMQDKDALARFGEARMHLARLEAETGDRKKF